MLLPQTSPENFQLGDKYTIFLKQVIGRGANAIVYKGQINRTSEVVAVKVIDTTQKWDSAQQTLLQNECAALRQVSHPNLLQLLEVIQLKGKFYLITKYYEGYTLQQYLTSQSHNQFDLVNIFSQILEGASHLTAKNILHRDLKPSNIIVTHNATAIIIDFGYCQLITNSKMRVFNVGSPSFMAPEAYLRTLYSEKSQSWSIAMILYFMLHRKLLDQGLDTKIYFQRFRTEENFLINRINKDLCNQLRELLIKAFKYDPSERISISAMKYLIDVLRIRNYKDQRQLSTPSIPHHNIKPVIKFVKRQSNNQQDSEPFSPLKRRELSAKQLTSRLSPAPKSQEPVPQKKIEHYPTIVFTTASTTNAKPKPLGNEFFTSKINKGVFDSKRFSATEKKIHFSPLKIAVKHVQNYIRISPKQI